MLSCHEETVSVLVPTDSNLGDTLQSLSVAKVEERGG